MTIPLKFDLKKTKVLPIWFSVILFTRMVITFTVFSFLQPISYLVIGLMCLNFIVISILYKAVLNDEKHSQAPIDMADVPTPKEFKEYLDQYV
ncbi:MAG: hypothetical protein II670_11075, partial [Alphaproteobacteria bacterium]|nr:hypothetical protein [Alphaproteobacteria bacterium]